MDDFQGCGGPVHCGGGQGAAVQRNMQPFPFLNLTSAHRTCVFALLGVSHGVKKPGLECWVQECLPATVGISELISMNNQL